MTARQKTRITLFIVAWAILWVFLAMWARIATAQVQTSSNIEVNFSLLPGATRTGDSIVLTATIRNRGEVSLPFTAMVNPSGSGWSTQRSTTIVNTSAQRFITTDKTNENHQYLSGIIEPAEEILIIVVGVGSDQGGTYETLLNVRGGNNQFERIVNGVIAVN